MAHLLGCAQFGEVLCSPWRHISHYSTHIDSANLYIKENYRIGLTHRTERELIKPLVALKLAQMRKQSATSEKFDNSVRKDHRGKHCANSHPEVCSSSEYAALTGGLPWGNQLASLGNGHKHQHQHKHHGRRGNRRCSLGGWGRATGSGHKRHNQCL